MQKFVSVELQVYDLVGTTPKLNFSQSSTDLKLTCLKVTLLLADII